MVLQRPFSFSDDSVDVQFPKVHDPSSPKSIPLRGNLTPLAAAVHLFKLRRHQSVWYQNLYHTGNDPSPDPKPDYYARRETLEKWLEAMPETITKANRDWLTLEWHYLYVYASAPCPKMPQPCEEALTAIFNHCVQYAMKFRRILSDQNNRTVYTFHDALRTYYVGMNLLHALWHNEEIVLNEGNIGTAMEGIKATTYVLSAMTIRWQDAEGLRDQFRQEASYMLAKLQQKMDEFLLNAPAIPTPPPSLNPIQSHLHHQRHPRQPQTTLPPSPLEQQPEQNPHYHNPSHSLNSAAHLLPPIPNISSHLSNPISQAALDNRLTFDFVEWPEYNAAVAAMNNSSQNGQVYNLSGHIATADFGNVAFYRYDERSWEDVHVGHGGH